MTTTRTRIVATTYTYFPSIPKRFECSEMLRLLESEEYTKDEDTYHFIERVIAMLLEENKEVSHDSVYGLTAVALYKKNLLDTCYSMGASIRKYGEKPANQPGARYRIQPVETLDNNHRYFVVKGEEEEKVVDPLLLYYKNTGNTVKRYSTRRISDYPSGIARGILAQFSKSTSEEITRRRDSKHNWFNTAVHRLAVRQNMLPSDWHNKDASTTKKRMGLEGYLRLLVPIFEEKSPDNWRYYLKEALLNEFREMGEESASQFVKRIQYEDGPAAPRSMYRQRKNVKMLEPNLDGRDGDR